MPMALSLGLGIEETTASTVDTARCVARGTAPMDFSTMMALEPQDTDVWLGAGPRYPWGGLFGGQIVAQALRAATFTVDDDFRVHSLHAYFIRSGDHTEPI